jgi:hypothetical protein
MTNESLAFRIADDPEPERVLRSLKGLARENQARDPVEDTLLAKFGSIPETGRVFGNQRP